MQSSEQKLADEILGVLVGAQVIAGFGVDGEQALELGLGSLGLAGGEQAPEVEPDLQRILEDVDAIVEYLRTQ